MVKQRTTSPAATFIRNGQEFATDTYDIYVLSTDRRHKARWAFASSDGTMESPCTLNQIRDLVELHRSPGCLRGSVHHCEKCHAPRHSDELDGQGCCC